MIIAGASVSTRKLRACPLLLPRVKRVAFVYTDGNQSINRYAD